MKAPIKIFEEMATGIQTASRWIAIIEREQKVAYRAGFENGYDLCSGIHAAGENLGKIKNVDEFINEVKGIRDEMDKDMEESGMAQGEIESCLNHWGNKYLIQKLILLMALNLFEIFHLLKPLSQI